MAIGSKDERAAPEAGVPEEGEKRRSKGSSWKELPILLVIAFILALLIKGFLVQAFFIPSGSMEPTLQIGDRVLVNRLSYRLHPIHRGDVVVFSDPSPSPQQHQNPFEAALHWVTDGLGATTPPTEDFIKRVIGLPGETVQVLHGGRVLIDGKPLSPEPYVNPATVDLPTDTTGIWQVPAGDLFVMGDNRGNSCDSRCFGFVPESKVIGRAFVIMWPPSQLRWLSTPAYRNGL